MLFEYILYMIIPRLSQYLSKLSFIPYAICLVLLSSFLVFGGSRYFHYPSIVTIKRQLIMATMELKWDWSSILGITSRNFLRKPTWWPFSEGKSWSPWYFKRVPYFQTKPYWETRKSWVRSKMEYEKNAIPPAWFGHWAMMSFQSLVLESSPSKTAPTVPKLGFNIGFGI